MIEISSARPAFQLPKCMSSLRNLGVTVGRHCVSSYPAACLSTGSAVTADVATACGTRL
jgi:hypothetical protein